MTNLFLMGASALLSITASPIAARDAKPAVTAAEPVGATTRNETPAAKPNTRYCLVDAPTGSRISHRVCKTRQEWMDSEGFDPLAKN